ncbi:MAG TPA: S8 family serine peptidase, partial [Anaerolineales bacterium]|nr:S8 family serine peptidase [Anaerolineales bacterium]
MKRFYNVLSVIILISFLFIPAPDPASAQSVRTRGAGLPQAQQADESVSRTNRIIVKFRDTTEALSNDEQAKARAAESLSTRSGIALRYFRTISDDASVLELPARLPLEEVRSLSEQLMTLPDVEYAEPDQVFNVTLTPNDTFYASQWHYKDTWGINAPAAWNVTTGLSTTVVAVVDTGITAHPELSGRTVPGYDFISYAQDGNDGNARDSNPSDPGDWVTSTERNTPGGWFEGCAVSDSSWHGTHVAGTIAANSNNSVGVSGINWNAKILPVRVLGKCGGYLSDIADGIRWAAGLPVSGVPANANPARVINVSIGGEGSCSPTYQTAINSATAAGATVVVAAGNDGTDASLSQPGNCSGVITVGATASDAWQASYSNWGPFVEISAPGGDMPFDSGVLSTMNAGTTVPAAHNYEYSQGTSMATPHVTGVISLMLARNPYLTPTEVLQILQSTARDFPPSSDCYGTSNCGAGIVDAAAAVNAVTPQTFADVSTGYWSWDFIERLSNAGITGGCATGPVRYCPEDTVTRAQMAIFLLRGIHGPSYTPPGVGGSTGFGDVPTTYWAGAWIKQLAAEAITGG